MNRVIKENPFLFNTINKPLKITCGKKKQIKQVVKCLESTMKGNISNIFIVGGNKTGKTSFMNLIKILCGEETEETINFYKDILDCEYMDFDFETYYVDCTKIRTISEMTNSLLEKCKKTFFSDVKVAFTARIKNLGADIQGNIKSEIYEEQFLKDKLENLIKKSNIATIFLFDNIFNFFQSNGNANIIKSIIETLTIKKNKNFLFVFSCTNSQYRLIKDKININHMLIKIDTLDKNIVKKSIHDMVDKESVNISHGKLDEIIKKFNYDIIKINDFLKRFDDKCEDSNTDDTIKNTYNDMKIHFSDIYGKTVQEFDYKQKNIVKKLLNESYIMRQGEVKSILGCNDINLVKPVIYMMEDKGIIEVCNEYSIKIKSDFIRECISDI